MSRAFVKEDDNIALESPPELLQGSGPNLMTERGFARIAEKLAEIERELGGEPDEATKNRLLRDQRYWEARKSMAVIVHPGTDGTVAFGSKVTFLRDGEKKTITIVGEDEADPASGFVNYRAPLAQVLLGARNGDTVFFENKEEPEEIRILEVGRYNARGASGENNDTGRGQPRA